MKREQKYYLKVLPIIEVMLGLFLLIREVVHLYSISRWLESIPMGLRGAIEFETVKFGYIFLWIVMFLTGVSYWISSKTYWILSQMLLLLITFRIALSYYWSFFEYPLTVCHSFSLFMYIYIQIKLFRVKRWNGIEIRNLEKYQGLTLGFFGCVILFFLSTY